MPQRCSCISVLAGSNVKGSCKLQFTLPNMNLRCRWLWNVDTINRLGKIYYVHVPTTLLLSLPLSIASHSNGSQFQKHELEKPPNHYKSLGEQLPIPCCNSEGLESFKNLRDGSLAFYVRLYDFYDPKLSNHKFLGYFVRSFPLIIFLVFVFPVFPE